MNIETIQDVIKWSATFHRSFKNHLLASLTTSQDERTKILAQYISEHELQLAANIEALQATESTNALATWCTEYLNEQPLPNTATTDQRWAAMPADQMFAQINTIYEQLIDFYRFLLSRCAATPAADSFEQLIDMHQHQLKLMAHSVNRLHDI